MAVAERRTAATADTFCQVYFTDPSREHMNGMDWAYRNTGPAAYTEPPVNERFLIHKYIKIWGKEPTGLCAPICFLRL